MQSRIKQQFSFKAAKAELESQEPISVADLAVELQTTEDKVFLLVKEGYLTPLKVSDHPFLYMVGKPKPAAMTWLRQALGPLPLIPIVPFYYVREMLGLSDWTLKRLILEHNIPLYIDVAFGQTMTILAFHQLFNQLYPWTERVRFDRQMFLNILCGIDKGSGNTFVRPLPFDKVLEEELHRIARLPEPQRSLRGYDIYEAFRDAKSIADVLKATEKTELELRVDRIMRVWKRRQDKRNSGWRRWQDFIDEQAKEAENERKKRHLPSSKSPSSSRRVSATSVATSSAGRSTKNPPSVAD